MSSEKELKNREIDLRDVIFSAITLAQAEVSKIRIGVAVLAINSKGDSSIFSGCNIEISFSRAFHAENVALLKAISSRYANIKAVAITSDSEIKQGAAMCGCCRQDYMYLNPDCMIYVFNPDKSLKLKVKLIDTMKYPYLSKGMIK
jgi:cytidine deaminase